MVAGERVAPESMVSASGEFDAESQAVRVQGLESRAIDRRDEIVHGVHPWGRISFCLANAMFVIPAHRWSASGVNVGAASGGRGACENSGPLPLHGDDARVGGEGFPAELNPGERKLTNGVGSVFADAYAPGLGFQRFAIRERRA